MQCHDALLTKGQCICKSDIIKMRCCKKLAAVTRMNNCERQPFVKKFHVVESGQVLVFKTLNMEMWMN